MSGLRFTIAGAVHHPEVLQVRLSHAFPGRVKAGAPKPSRDLTPKELEENLVFFAETNAGPRVRPCTSLVLSGANWSEAGVWLEPISLAREKGFRQVTVHSTVEDMAHLVQSPMNGRMDAVGLVMNRLPESGMLDAMHDLVNPAGERAHISVVLPLNVGGLEALRASTELLAKAKPDRVVLTWPLQSSVAPPPIIEIMEELPDALGRLDCDGVNVGIKGMPLCALGEYQERTWRSGNRYYVDAEHQKRDALMFFPDVVRFKKLDRCRQCKLNHLCDGVLEAWIDLGLAGAIEPIE